MRVSKRSFAGLAAVAVTVVVSGAVATPAFAAYTTCTNGCYQTSSGTGSLGPAMGGSISTSQMMARAKDWTVADGGLGVWYSQTEGWSDATVGGPYRADCSGLVSMAWGLPSSYVTGTLPQVSQELTHNGGQADYSQLQPGDALISSGHAVLFAYWADSGHTVAAVYEEHHDGVRTTGPATDQQSISSLSSGGFLPYRYDKVTGGSGSVTLPAWPNVEEGQTGPNVLAAQYLLIAHGATISADGQFGAATTTAVEAFQKANGLGEDGQVGPQTWAKLVVQIQTGSQGDAVMAAQTELNRYGYNLSVDGDFGSGTNSAAVSFQTAKGLEVDGQIGPQTWQALVGGTP